MKKLFFIAFSFFLALSAQAQDWSSSNRLDSEDEVVSINSESDKDANIFVYGYFTSSLSASSGESVTAYGGRDYFIAKFDSLSNVIWLKNLGSSGNDYVDGGMDVSADGSVFITGGFRSEFFYTPTESITSTGGFDTFILKYDADGNVIWIKHSGQGPFNQRPNALKADNTGNILVSGFFTDSINFDGEGALKSDNAFDDFYYAKFSQANGTLAWAQQIRAIDNPASGRITAIEAEAGSYSFAGLWQDSISIGNDTLVAQAIDAFVMKTDLDGNVAWLRQVSGASHEYTYTLQADDTDNEDLFLSGYFYSAPLVIDSTEADQITKDVHIGSSDIMVLKYSSDGIFQWIIAEGGSKTDKVWDINAQDTIGFITGSFTGSMMWGGIELTAKGGPTDVDMYIASYSNNGELLGANSYGGRLNSREEGRGVFENNGKTYAVLRSNSDLMVLGDSSYVSADTLFYLIVGNLGCKPVDVDFTSSTDLTCYNDSTGSLVIVASGGFGGPYKYSYDDGESYYENSGLFNNLPAMDYTIKVLDSQNCIGNGPSGTISQPDSIQFAYTVTGPCNDGLTGDIFMDTPTGGSNSGWEFSIDSGATYQAVGLFEDVALDNYYLIVKEDLECESPIIDTMLVASDSITYNFDLSKDSLSCFGDTDGEIHFKNVSGGTGALEFSINMTDFVADTFFLNLGGGDYSLVVRDANSCLSFVSDTSVYAPEELIISLDSSGNISDSTPGFIAVSAAGGTPEYSYTLFPTDTTQDSGMFPISTAEIYYVKVTDSMGCVDSTEEINITITSINNYNLLEALVYPNPTQGQITIQMPYDQSVCIIEVLSMTGQVVNSSVAYTNGGELNEVIDLGHLTSGMYMIKIDGRALKSGIVVN